MPSPALRAGAAAAALLGALAAPGSCSASALGGDIAPAGISLLQGAAVARRAASPRGSDRPPVWEGGGRPSPLPLEWRADAAAWADAEPLEDAARLAAEAADAQEEAAELREGARARREEAARLERDSQALLRLNLRLRQELQLAETSRTRTSRIVGAVSRAASSLLASASAGLRAGIGGGPNGTDTGPGAQGDGHAAFGVLAFCGLGLAMALWCASKAFDWVHDLGDEDDDGEVTAQDAYLKVRRVCCCGLSDGALCSLLGTLVLGAAAYYLLWGLGALQAMLQPLAVFSYFVLISAWGFSLVLQHVYRDVYEMAFVSRKLVHGQPVPDARRKESFTEPSEPQNES